MGNRDRVELLEFRISEIKKMLAHESNSNETKFGARLSHWYGDSKIVTIDEGGLRAIIAHYEAEKDRLLSADNDIRTGIPYVSVWDGGTYIETTCKVNTLTGEVFDIEVADVDDSVDVLNYEFLTIDGVDYDVVLDEETDERYVKYGEGQEFQ